MILMDTNGGTASSYQVRGTPTAYLIDGGGVIRMSQVGYSERWERHMRTAIRRVLSE